MGFIPADIRVGGRFDIGIDGSVSQPRFIVHRRMVDERDGTDMPDGGGVREMEVPADPADFDALFATSVAQIAADNQQRHEQVAVLINDKALAVAAEQEAKRERDAATLEAVRASAERDAAVEAELTAKRELEDAQKPGAKE